MVLFLSPGIIWSDETSLVSKNVCWQQQCHGTHLSNNWWDSKCIFQVAFFSEGTQYRSITRETWSSCFVLTGYMKKIMMVMKMKILKSYWVLAWWFFFPCYTVWILVSTYYFLKKTWNFYQNLIACIDLLNGNYYTGLPPTNIFWASLDTVL